MATSGDGSGGSDPAIEWDPDPTVADDARARLDTPAHDLTSLARASADHGDSVVLAYGEGQEDTIRALYAVMRERGLTVGEMDAIVLAVRQRFTRL